MSDPIGALGGVAATSGTDNSNVITNNNLGKEDFLNLLVTQMQYQDPLDPVKNEDFVAQMAQFSSLEQLINVNDTLGQVKLLETSMNNSQAVDLIGKTVTVLGNSVQIQDGESGSLDYVLYDDASKVSISIYDQDGALVRTLQMGPQTGGQQNTTFDGLDDEGNPLADGDYTFVVDAQNTDGESVDVTTLSKVIIDAVTFDNGAVWLLSGESRFSLSDVYEVR